MLSKRCSIQEGQFLLNCHLASFSWTTHQYGYYDYKVVFFWHHKSIDAQTTYQQSQGAAKWEVDVWLGE
jgi:hypothetical protein